MSKNDAQEPSSQDSSRTLTDSQIVTERRFSRRSFVAATGTLLAGGAVAVLTQGRADALQTTPPADPDHKQTDPDHKKSSDPDKKKHKHHHKKGSDPDKQKGSDPDKQKGADPDKQKTPAPATDPDR